MSQYQQSVAKRSMLPSVVMLVMVVGSAILVVNSSFESRTLLAQHQKQQAELNKMEVEWGQLLLEQSTWGSFNRVEQLATHKLKMRVPEPSEIVMVEPR